MTSYTDSMRPVFFLSRRVHFRFRGKSAGRALVGFVGTSVARTVRAAGDRRLRVQTKPARDTDVSEPKYKYLELYL